MDYTDIRKKFIELSGRYDLVKPTWEDNGADFFINAGQKMLDRAQDQGKAKARYTRSVVAGTVFVQMTGLRAVKEVWLSNADGMFPLTVTTIGELRENYGEKLSEVDQGTPEYYAPTVVRPYPDTTTAADVAGLYDIEDLVLYTATPSITGHWTYNGIVIMPPPSDTYTLSVWGLFYSPTLSATLSGSTWTQTKSFWSEVHPDTLLLAALYKLEAFYRNTEGAKDWQMALELDLRGMDNDFVEEDINGTSQMGG